MRQQAAHAESKQRFLCFCAACSVWVGACTAPASRSRPPPPPKAASAPAVAIVQPSLVPPDASAPDSGQAAAEAKITCPTVATTNEPGVPCGELKCLAFERPQAAFAHVLAQNPRALGVGETHAQKGTESVASATRRFAESLLPSLCGRAKAMILELWLPRNDCGDRRVEQVSRAQTPVTSAQAATNQNQYVTLGHLAQRLGIEPSALVPTCDEYQSILDAGPDNLERMLTLIADKTSERMLEELSRNSADPGRPLVIAYGGALHNDAEPDASHQQFSYGPRLSAATNNQYVELDLIVREYVKDTETWHKQPYYKALRSNPDPTRTLLYQWGPHSFGLVFPAAPRGVR